MSPDAAEAVLDPETLDAFRAVCDLAPPPVLDDLTTARARSVLAGTDLLITGWGCPPLDADVLRSAPRLRAVVHTAAASAGTSPRPAGSGASRCPPPRRPTPFRWRSTRSA